jgi:hypothetical protein
MRRHRDYLWRRDFFASITVVAADEIASAGKAAGAALWASPTRPLYS